MLSSNVPAFLKMLLIATVLEKRQVPDAVTLPIVGGGGLIYACLLPENFLQQHPTPRRDAPRAKWRDYAYLLSGSVDFQLNDVRARGFQS